MTSQILLSSCLRITLLATLLLSVSHLAADEKEDSDKEMLRVVQQKLLENRAGFHRCKINFSYLTGSTYTLKNAVSGKLTRVTKKQSCLFIAYDGYFHYERRHDLEFVKSNPGSALLYEHELSSLSDGSQASISINHSLGIATVRPTSDEVLGETVITPFDLLIMGAGERASPAKLIGRYLASDSDPVHCELVGLETIFETTCVKLEIHRKSGARVEYLLDKSRGHLPRKATVYKSDDSILRTVYVPQVQQAANGCWLPQQVIAADGPEGHVSVMMLEIENVEVNQRFRISDFSSSIPEGCVVFSMKGNRPGIRLPPRVREISAYDLPPLLNGTYTPPRDSNHLLLLLAVTIGTIVLILGVTYQVFFRRRSTTHLSNSP